MTNPLLSLEAAGQAVWLDYLHRKILDDGELARLISDDGLRGLTSNPSIFEQAIGGGDAYDGALAARIAECDGEIIDLYEHLAIADIQRAADAFRPLYDRLNGADGYVSLEVSPYLAMDTEGTIAEARRLWRAVDRPNLMVKVPGTSAGTPAIQTLIGEGININVTLLFSIDSYRAAADAHLAGLEALAASGGDVSRVHSVASVFVSRIDGVIDKVIDGRLRAGDPEAPALERLRGKIAIANAKLAYQLYLERLEAPRWKALAAAGAAPQRLLWASTGAKDPAYSDVVYMNGLVGADTVNTVPPKTLAAFRDHGAVTPSLTADLDAARSDLAEAERLGLDLAGVTRELTQDGVAKFAEAFDALLSAVASKRTRILGERLNAQSIHLPAELQSAVDGALARAANAGWTRRLWRGDATLWTNDGEAGWMGWLAAGGGDAVDLSALDALTAQVKAAGYSHVLLLGMGGSSLGPEVIGGVLGSAPGFPTLLVLDSTDPDQIARIEALIDPAKTLFIVSSKSGSTLEPDILHRYFYAVAEQALGVGKAGAHFVAVTDPGSKLESAAVKDGFAHVFMGVPSIGGRYSVLSHFGLVPAAAMGLDIRSMTATAAVMARGCGASAPPAVNPGFILGAVMGEAAKAGRDKVTLITSDGLAEIGAWLEQLIAESTGKQGRGLIPVAAEPLAEAGEYSQDRLFAYLRLARQDDEDRDALTRDLEEAGHPVIRITLANAGQLTQEFFRWEVATAVAGALIGINPFNQPDVESSKIKTRALTDALEAGEKTAPEAPLFESEGLAVYAEGADAKCLTSAVGTPSLDAFVAAHFARSGPGDYLGILAYLDRNEAHTEALTALRACLLKRRRLATVLGFGPRFLHSTGQAYKGGPDTGVFLEITATPDSDIAIPGRKLTFGEVEAAQARGDLSVLAERGRRLMRIDLGDDIEGGLKRLAKAVDQALA